MKRICGKKMLKLTMALLIIRIESMVVEAIHIESNDSTASTLFNPTVIESVKFPQLPSSTASDIASRHKESIPDYYPMKTSKLFTKYIVLDNECDFELMKRNQMNETNEYFEGEQKKKFSSTSMLSNESDIRLDFDSFRCEKLLTLHSNYIWKISFEINVYRLDDPTQIKDFEVFVTAEGDEGQIRSVGRVNDGKSIEMNGNFHRVHDAEFYIYEAELIHTIEVLYSHPDKWYDF